MLHRTSLLTAVVMALGLTLVFGAPILLAGRPGKLLALPKDHVVIKKGGPAYYLARRYSIRVYEVGAQEATLLIADVGGTSAGLRKVHKGTVIRLGNHQITVKRLHPPRVTLLIPGSSKKKK